MAFSREQQYYINVNPPLSSQNIVVHSEKLFAGKSPNKFMSVHVPFFDKISIDYCLRTLHSSPSKTFVHFAENSLI